jgi:hypothetical protein
VKNITTLLLIFASHFIIAQTCTGDLQNFNTASPASPPIGWQRGNGTDISTPSNGGDRAVGFNEVGEFIVSKEYSCGGQVCFSYKASGTSSNWDLTVSYSQGDSSHATVWNTLGVISTNGTGSSPTTYQNICYDIPEANLLFPFGVRVRWQMTRRVGGTIYFDDVCVNGGTCQVQPSKFTFNKLANGCLIANQPNTIRVCATDNNGNTATNYNGPISISALAGGAIYGTTSGTAVNGCFDATINFANEASFILAASSSANSYSGNSDPIFVANTCPLEDTIRVMSYNILNFPLGRNDCASNTLIPRRWDTLAKICTYIKPDVLMVCELQNEWGADSILVALNRTSSFLWKRGVFTTNRSTSFQGLNNMMFYNSEKLSLKGQDEVVNTTRDINRYIIYGNDPGLSSHLDTTFIDLYMSHLKAGPSGSDSIDRAQDCQFLRTYIDAFPTQRNFVLGGDLNLYTNLEGAYTTLLGGTYPFKDPINLNVNWEANPAYAYSHTQSSRSAASPNLDCGIVGGCDSRFDYLLTSASIINNTDSVKYLAGTYHVPGNNGSIYNKSINDAGNTSSMPRSILNAMYYMSDHLPVVMDLKMSYKSLTGPCSKVVTSNNETMTNSIRNAINCAMSGDVITFDPLLSNQTIILTDSIVINKSIIIKSSLMDNITLSPSPGMKNMFIIAPHVDVIIDGITINGGIGPEGSAIKNYGGLTLNSVTLKKNGAVGISSILLNEGGLVLSENCKIID